MIGPDMRTAQALSMVVVVVAFGLLLSIHGVLLRGAMERAEPPR